MLQVLEGQLGEFPGTSCCLWRQGLRIQMAEEMFIKDSRHQERAKGEFVLLGQMAMGQDEGGPESGSPESPLGSYVSLMPSSLEQTGPLYLGSTRYEGSTSSKRQHLRHSECPYFMQM